VAKIMDAALPTYRRLWSGVDIRRAADAEVMERKMCGEGMMAARHRHAAIRALPRGLQPGRTEEKKGLPAG